jgi:7,8-dihydropterin-6-yl-methyl-4-(beta-D-ribofuranosyl)aminobenzene 5'-phosphate synthase
MKLTVLTENAASGKFAAEHGLSYLIEHDNTMLLFDTGHSDIFLKNAIKLNIDIDKVQTVALSHGHWDHGDGLRFINNKKLISHPDIFKKRYSKNSGNYIGLSMTKNEIYKNFEFISSLTPFHITDKIIFLGEIPRENDFESKKTTFIDENGIYDFVPDDSALAIINNNQLVVISGCAHSGICNTIEYAKNVTGISTIQTVIGGFHLKVNDVQTKKTIEYLKQLDIENILPSHCTELPVLANFFYEFGIKHVKSGMIFEF